MARMRKMWLVGLGLILALGLALGALGDRMLGSGSSGAEVKDLLARGSNGSEVKDQHNKTATTADSDSVVTYVGQAECAKCHADKVKDYSMTGHVADFKPISDFNVANPNLKVTITDPDTKTNPTTADITLDNSTILGVFMGDHIVAKAPEGFAQKYIRLGELSKNADGTYTIEADAAESFASCGKCHAPGEAVAGQTTSAEAGITCEACHGPGSAHVAATTTADRKTTMAASLTPETCYKCHPVDNLPASTVNTASGGLPNATSLQAVNHYGVRGFYATKHYTSAKLNSCLTCHNPHVQPKAGYILNVLDKEKDQAQNLCNQCHANLVTANTIKQAFWVNPTDSRTAANVVGHNTRDHSMFRLWLSDYVYDPAKAGFQLGTNATKQLKTLYPELFATQ